MLALVTLGAARGIGPLPALGPLLDPVHGVWALARRPDAGGAAATVAIPGLRAPVRVVYDDRAVPHIFAREEEDVYRALGWVVARDRLFQLHVQQLAAAGRLTEIAGPAALPLDREMRRLGLPRAAERKLAALGDDAPGVRLARAYADGVNAYGDQLRPEALPLEFRLLGTRPERWGAVNAMHLLGRMGWTLAYDAPELNQWAAAARVGRAAAEALFPASSPIVEPIAVTGAAAAPRPGGARYPRFDFAPLPPPAAPDSTAAVVARAVDALMPARARHTGDDEPRSFASNNWAVAPRRARGGHALLAGDPHLELTLPSIWYEVHLVVPGTLDVYGVTIPGAPGMIIGFNRDIAWTFTNAGADVLDFYAETVDDTAAPTRYLTDGAWRPLERRIERYLGKDGSVVAVDTLRFTHRGPLQRAGARGERGGRGGRWLSMRWTVLEPSDDLAAFHGAERARSVAEFEGAMARYYRAPAQNMLVADRAGAIAIRSTGRFPVRPGDGDGTRLRDGARSASDWRGDLPPGRYPQARDPAQGYLASANQQPVDPRAAPGYFGGSYDPWRALRINRLLRADSAVTPDAMRRYQTDPGSERAALFVPHFLRAGRGTRAAELLARWDQRYTLDNRGAVLFEAAMRELVRRTWDELLDPAGARRVATPRTEVLAGLLADSASAWWDDRRTPQRETRDAVIASSLAAALDSVTARYGPYGAGWEWRRIRHANILHLLRIPALSALELPVPGGPGTLWPSDGRGAYGPSWRMVVELAPTVRAWGIYPGGQSGDPASGHYRDRLPAWLAGELQPLLVPATPEALGAAHTAAALTLVAPDRAARR